MGDEERFMRARQIGIALQKVLDEEGLDPSQKMVAAETLVVWLIVEHCNWKTVDDAVALMCTSIAAKVDVMRQEFPELRPPQ